MTLAVCAIAMVGLGFALTTSVTSNSNAVEKLMIDLDEDYDDINGQTAPDETDVNSLFDYRITSTKSSNTNDDSVTINYKLNSDDSYLKVFSNVDGKKATLKVSGKGISVKPTEEQASFEGLITKVVLGLYESKSNGTTNGTAIAYATITSSTVVGSEAIFGNSSTNESGETIFTKCDVTEGTVYIVKIDKITIEGIEYVSESTGITITKTGSNYTINPGTTTVTGFPTFSSTYNSLEFTFTAEADPKA
ncbi:MAG: hypothetical protein IJX35_02960 [Candidatus Methanomethylophilaceae archaeon]|nr:hypothetical protein [Candidatus Methanomethylophilaceae archaeon]